MGSLLRLPSTDLQQPKAQGSRILHQLLSGSAFLGTPHRGSATASLGKVAYRVTVAATRRPNIRLLQGLERNSEILEQIDNAFAQTILEYSRKLRIFSFREEKGTRKYLFFNTMVGRRAVCLLQSPFSEPYRLSTRTPPKLVMAMKKSGAFRPITGK